MSKMGVWMGICYGNIVSISSFFPLGSPHTKIKRFCASELLFAIRPQKRTKISNANREKCIIYRTKKLHHSSARHVGRVHTARGPVRHSGRGSGMRRLRMRHGPMGMLGRPLASRVPRGATTVRPKRDSAKANGSHAHECQSSDFMA
jgi:hypothetical protein